MTNALLPASFEDYRAMAEKRLPRQLFDFVDGGSYAESTLQANRDDFGLYSLRQQVLRDVSRVSLETDVFGQYWSMPVGLAPIGLSGLMHRRGEVQAVRAANAAKVPFVLSTVSLCSIEEVAAAATEPFWFQVYMMKDRGVVSDLIARAKAAKCSALMLTVDLALPGARYRDVRSGMTGGLGLAGNLAVFLDRARRLGWITDVGLNGRPHIFGNLTHAVPDARKLDQFYAFVMQNFDPSVTWNDVAWIRSQWDGPLVLKGILDADDARHAADAGAQAVVISNHGGRQLDGAPSTISMLPRIADAVGDRLDLILDGGIRYGVDVMKALSLGARACMIGRPWAFALAAMGETGVSKVLATMRRELEVGAALAGVTVLRDMNRECLVAPDRRTQFP